MQVEFARDMHTRILNLNQSVLTRQVVHEGVQESRIVRNSDKRMIRHYQHRRPKDRISKEQPRSQPNQWATYAITKMDITFHILNGLTLKALLRRTKKSRRPFGVNFDVHTTPPRAYNFQACFLAHVQLDLRGL